MTTHIIDTFQTTIADTLVNVTVTDGLVTDILTADDEERPIHVDPKGVFDLLVIYERLLQEHKRSMK